MSQGVRDLFTRSVRESVYPGLSEENLHKSSLFLQFSSDRLFLQWILQGISRFWAEEGGLEPSASADPAQLVGKPAPTLGVDDLSREKVSFGPTGPQLIYIAPAWPRPFVAREEGFADLQSLERISQEVRGPGVSVLGIGMEATAAEIRGLWEQRRIHLPPRVLTPNSADALGLQHLPLALVVDSNGRVAWAKEGYSPGDEATWRSQLRKVRG
jgi:hypothetical protein